MSTTSSQPSSLLRVPFLLLISALAATMLAADLGTPTRAWAHDDDDDPSTGERALGTFLGSADGALIARALTLREERTPAVAMLYAGAICGGATVGYLLAGDEDAMTVMGIMLIPLVILNIALPSTNPYFEAVPYLSGGPAAAPPALSAGGDRQTASSSYGAQEQGQPGDWWRISLLHLVPQPAAHGARLTPLRVRF